MSSLSKLGEKIAKLEMAAERVEDATRAANAATSDLRSAEKAVRDLLDSDMIELVKSSIDESVEKGLKQHGEELRSAMDAGVEKVSLEFDRLAKLYLRGGDNRLPSLEELALAKNKSREGI